MLSKVLMGRQWGIRAALQVFNVQPIQPKTKASLGPKDLAFHRTNLRWKTKLNGRQTVVHDKEELCHCAAQERKGPPHKVACRTQRTSMGRGDQVVPKSPPTLLPDTGTIGPQPFGYSNLVHFLIL